jgi:hypothetical protein
MDNLNDEEINKYVNEAICEHIIQNYENEILLTLKTRFEKYPTEKNNEEWLNYTNFVCKRRCQHNQKKEKTC